MKSLLRTFKFHIANLSILNKQEIRLEKYKVILLIRPLTYEEHAEIKEKD